jgi:tRNA pseudouridine32 synthase / 23S rRNA pseudouridine746 synthase
MPPEDITAEEMVSRLLYRDGLMLVVDKPAGIAVHRGPKGGASLEDYFGALRFGLPRAPALAHRLDRDTSGCLVLGRYRKALAQLGKLFKSGAIGKTYWAVVEGGPDGDEGQIALPLGRLDLARGWWMKHDPAGQAAVTKWKVLGRSAAARDFIASPLEGEAAERSSAGGGSIKDSHPSRNPLPQPSPVKLALGRAQARPGWGEGARLASSSAAHQLTWLALEPLTGRTHQLRVHCAAMGWPILGDAIYGTASSKDGPKDASMLHLHAREVVVPLYKNRAPIRVVAPIPAPIRAVLSQCGWRDDEAGKCGSLPASTASP